MADVRRDPSLNSKTCYDSPFEQLNTSEVKTIAMTSLTISDEYLEIEPNNKHSFADDYNGFILMNSRS